MKYALWEYNFFGEVTSFVSEKTPMCIAIVMENIRPLCFRGNSIIPICLISMQLLSRGVFFLNFLFPQDFLEKLLKRRCRTRHKLFAKRAIFPGGGILLCREYLRFPGTHEWKRERLRKWTRGKGTKRSGTMRAVVVHHIRNDVYIFIGGLSPYCECLAERRKDRGIVAY